MTKYFYFFLFLFPFNICFAENCIHYTHNEIFSTMELRAMILAYEKVNDFPKLDFVNPGDDLSIYLARSDKNYLIDLGDIGNSFVVRISKRNKNKPLTLYHWGAVFAVSKDNFEVTSSSEFYQR